MYGWRDAGLPLVKASAPPALDGRGLYVKHCLSCHQTEGKGLGESFPPLDGDPLTLADDPTGLLWVIEDGLGAAGEARMPGYRQALTPQEVADLATYVRGAWSNRASAVGVAQVEAVRAQAAASASAQPDGAAIYARRCAGCHLPGGQGLPNAVPDLRGHALLKAPDAAPLARVLLGGVGTPGLFRMPPFRDDLNDAEIAALATHLRQRFGGPAEPVSAEVARAARAKLQ